MPSFDPKGADAPDFVALMQALSRASQALSMHDAALHRDSRSGLTPSQADVIFTVGGTEGMTCADVGAETLITKGTLTGVIDRLRSKGLVERWADAYDARRTLIALTDKGEAVYRRELPRHLAGLKDRFDRIPEADRRRATRLLEKISAALAGD